MGEIPSPDQQPNFEQDIAQLQAENDEIRWHKYLGDVLEFRSGIMEKLTRHNASNKNGAGWAVFHVEKPGEKAGELIDGRKEIFIYIPSSTPEPLTIRIFTNEVVSMSEGEVACISEDFTVDSDNDSQYFLSVFDPTINLSPEETSAVMFNVTGPHGISGANIETFTPIIGVTDDDYPGEVVFPFGMFNCLEDKICALEKATEIFAIMKDQEPVATFDPQ